MTLPENIIRCISPKTRKELRVQTAEEAMQAFVVRNERELHTQISQLLSLRGIWCCHSRTDRPTTQRKGVPDFLLAVRSVPMAWEVKHGKGKLSPEQETTRDAMIRDGWKWTLVTSLEQAIALLNEGEGRA